MQNQVLDGEEYHDPFEILPTERFATHLHRSLAKNEHIIRLRSVCESWWIDEYVERTLMKIYLKFNTNSKQVSQPCLRSCLFIEFTLKDLYYSDPCCSTDLPAIGDAYFI